MLPPIVTPSNELPNPIKPVLSNPTNTLVRATGVPDAKGIIAPVTPANPVDPVASVGPAHVIPVPLVNPI